MISKDLINGPVSTANPAFIEAVRNGLSGGNGLIVLKRLNRCGGAKQAYHLTSVEQFKTILGRSKAGDSFSVFFPSAFPLRGRTGEIFAKQAWTYLQSLRASKTWGAVVGISGGTEPVDFEFVETSEEIQTWFDEHPNVEVAMGKMEFAKANCDEVLTAYVPDPDGVVRLGAY